MFNYSFVEDYFTFSIFLVVHEMETADFCLLRVSNRLTVRSLHFQNSDVGKSLPGRQHR
jgi:hypothetical protein